MNGDNAVNMALLGCGELQRMATAIAGALEAFDSVVSAVSNARTELRTLSNASNTGAEAADRAQSFFRAASRLVADDTDTEGHRLALDVSQLAIGQQNTRREIGALVRQLDDVALVVAALKEKAENNGTQALALREQGQEYATRLGQ